MKARGRILSILIVLAMAFTMLPTSVFAAEIPDNTYNPVVNAGGTNYYDTAGKESESGKEIVNISKTAESTGVENEFEITLEVRTTVNIEEISVTEDTATVLVMDVSGSMDWCASCSNKGAHSTHGSQTRLAAAKSSAKTFLKTYADSAKEDEEGNKPQRLISIVKFATDGKMAAEWTWIDVATTAGYNTAVGVIDSLSANGRTNIDAGLMLARNLYSESGAFADHKAITNRNVILLTDGEANRYATTDSTGLGTIFGNTGDSTSTAETRAATRAGEVKALAKLYTIAYAEAKSAWLGGLASSGCNHDAKNASQLEIAFLEISKQIEISAQAWTVTDPMGKNYINWVPGNDTSASYIEFDDQTDTLTWDLKTSDFIREGDWFVYTYKYKVTLDTAGDKFVEDHAYPTNEQTTLNYVIVESIDGIDKVSENYIVDFLIPEVQGKLPKADTTYEVRYYTDSVTDPTAPNYLGKVDGTGKVDDQIQVTSIDLAKFRPETYVGDGEIQEPMPYTLKLADNVINVVYKTKASYDYIIEYYTKDGDAETKFDQAAPRSATLDSIIELAEADRIPPTNGIPDGYKYDSNSGPITITTGENVIKVYFVLDTENNIAYNVEHYRLDTGEMFDSGVGYVPVARPILNSAPATSDKVPAGFAFSYMDHETYPLRITNGMTIKLYYDDVGNVIHYTVRHIVVGEDAPFDSYAMTVSETKPILYVRPPVSPDAPDGYGYVYADPDEKRFPLTIADGAVITLYYDKLGDEIDIEIIHEYYLEKTELEGSDKSESVDGRTLENSQGIIDTVAKNLRQPKFGTTTYGYWETFIERKLVGEKPFTDDLDAATAALKATIDEQLTKIADQNNLTLEQVQGYHDQYRNGVLGSDMKDLETQINALKPSLGHSVSLGFCGNGAGVDEISDELTDEELYALNKLRDELSLLRNLYSAFAGNSTLGSAQKQLDQLNREGAVALLAAVTSENWKNDVLEATAFSYEPGIYTYTIRIKYTRAEDPTDPPTIPTTDPPTVPATEPPTEAPTEPTTRDRDRERDRGGADQDTMRRSNVTITDPDVPLAEAPITIMDEEVPLAKLPQTGGRSRRAGAVGGLMIGLAALLRVLRKKEEDDEI